MQQQNTEDDFLELNIWTDETCYTRDRVFSYNNSYMLFQVSSHTVRPQTILESWSGNMWLSILGDRLLGPYLLPEELSGQSYLLFLNHVLTEFLHDKPFATISDLWFQHDETPVNFCAPVRDWLIMAYPGS